MSRASKLLEELGVEYKVRNAASGNIYDAHGNILDAREDAVTRMARDLIDHQVLEYHNKKLRAIHSFGVDNWTIVPSEELAKDQLINSPTGVLDLSRASEKIHTNESGNSEARIKAAQAQLDRIRASQAEREARHAKNRDRLDRVRRSYSKVKSVVTAPARAANTVNKHPVGNFLLHLGGSRF